MIDIISPFSFAACMNAALFHFHAADFSFIRRQRYHCYFIAFRFSEIS